ncbi:MAG: sensor domain-containing diguanylate cyclase [Deltaproteobacteria bacterium]|nr:sensor domain-containing diguanylate cyclase [Deltaproteobacteria bacterium]
MEKEKIPREELETRIRDLEKRVVELYTLYNISRNLSVTLQLDELFKRSMDLIADSLSLEQFFLVLLEEDGLNLSVQAFHGFAAEKLAGLRFKLDDGLLGKAVSTGETLSLNEGERDKKDPLTELGCNGSLLILPLKVEDQPAIGALVAHNKDGSGFSAKDRSLIAEIAGQVANAIHKARIYQKARDLSYRDELTGLFNRRYLFERLEAEVERARRYKRNLSFIIFDVDHFKRFNDNYGHLVGDDALRAVATAMAGALRRHDVIARFGGEEFVVLLPETKGPAARAVAEKLRKRVSGIELRDPKGEKLQGLTITAGVSVFPDNAPEALLLIGEADRALYAGKKGGRNRVTAADDLGDEAGEDMPI